MREYNLREMVYKFQMDVCYYKHAQLLATCPYEKVYYERLIMLRNEELINFIKTISNKLNERSVVFNRKKEFTLEELSTYDGASGSAAYVAVDGTVYDISKESTWGAGTHFGLYAGKDLTAQFMGCHKGMLEVLNKLPKVGTLRK